MSVGGELVFGTARGQGMAVWLAGCVTSLKSTTTTCTAHTLLPHKLHV